VEQTDLRQQVLQRPVSIISGCLLLVYSFPAPRRPPGKYPIHSIRAMGRHPRARGTHDLGKPWYASAGHDVGRYHCWAERVVNELKRTRTAVERPDARRSLRMHVSRTGRVCQSRLVVLASGMAVGLTSMSSAGELERSRRSFLHALL